MTLLDRDEPCPCGVEPFASCCGPLLAGTARPATAQQLMRSRYTAFARGDVDHLWRTWHPRTRPEDVALDPGVRWIGLVVRDVVAGAEDDESGEVEFEARFTTPQGPGAMIERSMFERRGGRWVYVDGIRTG